MFSLIKDVIERFAKNNYIASRRIATVIYLASELRKPILVEGPAGVGKTDLAKVLADIARLRDDTSSAPPKASTRARRFTNGRTPSSCSIPRFQKTKSARCWSAPRA